MPVSVRPRAILYVDGFNLYYGALKGTPHKWLNPLQLGRLVFQNFDFVGVRYCSAAVSARPSDPQQPLRQDLYFRALATVPEITVTLGNFLVSTPRMMEHPPTVPPRFVQVVKTEEKGSDVNLATHLLCDAYEGLFDIAVVVTNDSDLVMPIQQVRQRLGKKVFLLCPRQRASFELQKNVDGVRHIRQGVLQAAQFPATLTDPNGTFTKPPSW